MHVPSNRTTDSSRRNWVFLTIVLALTAAVVLRLTLFEGVIAQQIGFPTPPPGPVFPVPSDSQINAAIMVSVESPGTAVQVVRPSWPGPVPLIPPIQSTSFHFSDPSWDAVPLTLRVDAGTFSEVVQIRVSSLDPGQFARQVLGSLLAYQIEVFDASGRDWQTAFERPIKVSMPVAALAAALERNDRLLYYEIEDDVVTPLVTAMNLDVFDLTARIVDPGVLVIATR